MHLGKDSALDSCPVCLAANIKAGIAVTGKRVLLPSQGKVCHWILCLRVSIRRMPRIRNKCGSMITWVSTGGNMLSTVVRSRNGTTGRSMSTVKGATYSMAEEVAHEERERRCERSMRLHGSGRRVIQIQSD